MTSPGYRWQVAALCSGYGGLELALTEAGLDHDLAWWSEIDPHAAQVMGAHTPAPNLGDLCAITCPPAVDIVTAGWPCQPVSVSGRRAGMADERWLIRDVVAVWRSSGAHWLILENVPGLLSANDGAAFGEVLDALGEVGATVEWACLRASDVGSCHRRERWFAVATAYTHGPRLEGPSGLGPRRCEEPKPARGDHGSLADSDGGEPERWGGPSELGGPPSAEPGQGLQRERAGHPAGHGRPAPADPDGGRCGKQWLSWIPSHTNPQPVGHIDRCDSARFGGYAAAVERWAHAIGRPAPDPTIDGRLSPLFVEWMMGLPTGWVTDCGLSRTQALRVLGNGVVPQQAAAAIGILCAA